MRWLHEAGPRLQPKAQTLARAAAAGLPVPRGLVLELDQAASPPGSGDVERAIDSLLAQGPVIVRAAIAVEDGTEASAAGLGLSVRDCGDRTAVARAVAQIRAHGDDRWLQAYGAKRDDPTQTDQVLIQHQVVHRALLVIARGRDTGTYVEAHDGADGVGGAASPRFAGAIENLPPEWGGSAVLRLVERVEETFAGDGTTALDLEVAVDRHGSPWLVQVRPLTRPLVPGWGAFAAAVAAAGQAFPPGTLTLDAEHNPEPLSPAHGWLLDRLRTAQPGGGGPRALAGWLYVHTLPRALTGGEPGGGETPDRPDPRTVLATLRDRHLPEARARLEALQLALGTADAHAVADALERAVTDFLAMVAVYLRELVPARAGFARRTASASTPHTLRGRAAYLDVLPATWDVASPTLAELRAAGHRWAVDGDTSDDLPETAEAAATLLTEWDDHLFALGLAPVRAVYLAAAEHLGLDAENVFLLRGEELVDALRNGTDTDALRAERHRSQEAFAALTPPPRIHDGRPLPAPPSGARRGVGIGPPAEGPLAHRQNLADALARPPAPGAILALPALTAQAAVALRELGVKAVVCAHGGAMSHAALMARELGLSALIGCRASADVPDGTRVRLDTRVGRLVTDARVGEPG